MADHETGEYHKSEAGASMTVPMQCGSLKKGAHVCIKGRPCKIVDYSTSKTGKHGHAKANIVGIDIFTGKKLEEMCPTSHNLDVPNVLRTEFQLIDINEEGYCSLMGDDGSEKSDLRLFFSSSESLDVRVAVPGLHPHQRPHRPAVRVLWRPQANCERGRDVSPPPSGKPFKSFGSRGPRG